MPLPLTIHHDDTLSPVAGLLVGAQGLPHFPCLPKGSAGWERDGVDIAWNQTCPPRKVTLVLLTEPNHPARDWGGGGARVSPETDASFYKTL